MSSIMNGMGRPIATWNTQSNVSFSQKIIDNLSNCMAERPLGYSLGIKSDFSAELEQLTSGNYPTYDASLDEETAHDEYAITFLPELVDELTDLRSFPSVHIEGSLSDDLSNFGPAELDIQQINEATMNSAVAPENAVTRTNRGTIAFVCQPNGRTITPIYNRCGIMTGARFSDGIVVDSTRRGWILKEPDGASYELRGLFFDNEGNLTTVHTTGRCVKYMLDGTILLTRAA